MSTLPTHFPTVHANTSSSCVYISIQDNSCQAGNIPVIWDLVWSNWLWRFLYAINPSPFLLLTDLCNPAGYFEYYLFAVWSYYLHFGLARAAVADGDRKGCAICITGRTLFNNLDLDGVEGEDLQGKADPMAAGYGFSVVGIDEFPLVSLLTGELLNEKGKLVNALTKMLRWH